ncbi:MAG: carbohydrate ABC transporter permease [Spirochaetales bacterium]|nr:carbohydrate ABC transporter permease [Spirochaetales bacterium]
MILEQNSKLNILQLKRDKHILNLKRAGCYIVLGLLTIISLFPFIILVINSTRLHAQIMQGFSLVPGTAFAKNFIELFSDNNIPILRALINSVIISTFVAFLSTYFSSMTAYAIHMYRFKGRNVAFRFIMMVMMVPPQVSALGFLRLVIDMKMMDTFYPLIIPAIAAPFIFFFMLQYMQATLPFEIVEAARIDGSNEIRTFNTIVLPILKPAMAVQAIFSFVAAWNNYFMPALIINSKLNKTIPILIADLRGADYMKFDYGKVYMLVAIAIIPLMLVYFVLSKNIIKGVTLGSVKG